MKITEVTSEVMGNIKEVENGVHEAIVEFNEKNEVKSGNKGFVVIPSAIAHKLFKMGEAGIDALLLYNFLQYTALWQDDKFGINNRPKATNDYCLKALHIRKQDFLKAKKILVNEGLVVPRVDKDKKSGKVKGHYIELPFINNHKNPEVPAGTHGEKTRGSQNHPMDMGTTNTDTKDRVNTDDKDIFTCGEKNTLENSKETHEVINSDNTLQTHGKGALPRAAHTISNLSVSRVKTPFIESNDAGAWINQESWKTYETAMALTEKEAQKISDDLAKEGIKISMKMVLKKQPAQMDYIQRDVLNGKKIPTLKYEFIPRYKNFLRNADPRSLKESVSRLVGWEI